MLMSMSSRDMSGSSAFSTSSCSSDWKMSTGGIQVLFGAVNPKSRNGSQRTMVMMSSMSLVGRVRRVGRTTFYPPYLPYRPVCLLRLRVICVDHFCVLHVRIRSRRRGPGARRLRGLLIELLRNRVRGALQLVGRLPDGGQVVALRYLAQLRDRGFDLGQIADRDLPAVVVDRLLHLIRQRIGLVARVDQIAACLILARVALR